MSVEESWGKIERWIAHHAPEEDPLPAPCTRADLDALYESLGGQLPDDVERSLLRHNGSGLTVILPPGFTLLGVEDILLVDDDLRFEDGPAAPRATAVVNRWLRELPAGGAPAPSSWENYARAVKEWMEFLAEHGEGLFDSCERLKAGLSRYSALRAR